MAVAVQVEGPVDRIAQAFEIQWLEPKSLTELDIERGSYLEPVPVQEDGRVSVPVEDVLLPASGNAVATPCYVSG